MKNLTLAPHILSILSFIVLLSNCGSDKKSSSGAEGGTAGQSGNEGGSAGKTGGEGGTSGNAGSSGGDSATGGVSVPVDTTVPKQPWDYTGIIGSGQSLAVGDHGTPVVTKTQTYNNLKLTTGTLAFPVDPNDATLSLVPLIEPVGRLAPGYPSSWPTNIAGETPHTSMANQITAMVKAAGGNDYIGIHGEFGENGQCLSFLVKGAAESGVNGRAYAATLIETQAVTRLAQAAGKTYGVGALILTHGECDAGNTNYEAQVHQLLMDYDADIAAITGQTQKIQLITSQQNSTNDYSASTLAQWKIGVDYPDEVVCSGPHYQYLTASDGTHLRTDGYRQIGEKYGQVYYERVVMGRKWQPLQPLSAKRDGQIITVKFHVPVLPLAWESTFQTPHAGITAWEAGKGFEVKSGSSRITISSVEIAGDSVKITCEGTLPASGLRVAYAMTANAAPMTVPQRGTRRWGLLRDSDPFVGQETKLPQPNYALAFDMDVP